VLDQPGRLGTGEKGPIPYRCTLHLTESRLQSDEPKIISLTLCRKYLSYVYQEGYAPLEGQISF
jgi:hypothetical protein